MSSRNIPEKGVQVKIQIEYLSDINANFPREWAEQGRMSVLGGAPDKFPFSYVWKGVHCYIHDFRDDKNYVYTPFDPEYIETQKSSEVRGKDFNKEEIIRVPILLDIWKYNMYKGVGGHLYLQKKNIHSYGKVKRLEGTDRLTVPMYDTEGVIRSFQNIFIDKKLFLKGVSTKELFYSDMVFGSSKLLKGRFFMCEGYATYRTLRKYLPFDGMCCFSKSNMLKLAERFKKEGKQFIVMHDLDSEAYPTSPPHPSDWNDTELIFLKEENKVQGEEEAYIPKPTDISKKVGVRISRVLRNFKWYS